MSEKANEVSVEEMVVAGAIEVDALIAVLVKKGVLRRQEVLDEIRAIRHQIEDRAGSA